MNQISFQDGAAMVTTKPRAGLTSLRSRDCLDQGPRRVTMIGLLLL
jgi:hypothetical protein